MYFCLAGLISWSLGAVLGGGGLHLKYMQPTWLSICLCKFFLIFEIERKPYVFMFPYFLKFSFCLHSVLLPDHNSIFRESTVKDDWIMMEKNSWGLILIFARRQYTAKRMAFWKKVTAWRQKDQRSIIDEWEKGQRLVYGYTTRCCTQFFLTSSLSISRELFTNYGSTILSSSLRCQRSNFSSGYVW